MDGSGKDAGWFHERMPERSVLRDLLRGNPVSRLLGIARDRAIVDGSVQVASRAGADEQAVRAALEAAVAAAKLISDKGPAAELSVEQTHALELFVLLVSRPALFVRDGAVADRPDNWPELGRDSALLPDTIAGVGRIERADGARCGTGFLVGERRILTNNHVVCALLGKKLDLWNTGADEFAALCEQHGAAWGAPGAATPRFEPWGELESTR